MKKNFKRLVVSIALSLSMCCTLLGVAFAGIFNPTYVSAEAEVLQGFTLQEGAAVRKSDPNGIRFTTNFTKEAKAKTEALDNVTYGTLLLPGDLLGSEELTLDTAKAVKLEISKWKTDYVYQSALVGSQNEDGTYNNLPESYYNRPIAARSYVTGTKGNEKVTYYSENTEVRSIGYVAYMANLAGDTSDLVKDIVSKTNVEIAFNNEVQISAVNSNGNGTAIIENKFKESTESAAVIMIGGVPLSKEAMTQYNASISYTSSVPSIISVNGTKLTAVDNGEAVITASGTFNGMSLTPVSKTMSTNAYKAQSNYKILISEGAAKGPVNANTSYKPAMDVDEYMTAFEKTAAYKLQSVLREATGVELEIVTAMEGDYKYISVGETALASSITLGSDTMAKDTASEVKVVDGNVIIRGTTPRGTLYGTQELLGDLVGYEFYMENSYSVNEAAEVVLDANKAYIPDIEYNVLQGDLDRNGVGDEFGIQMYTEGIVPTGTTDWEDANGYNYRGISHNSLWVYDVGTYDNAVYDEASTDWRDCYATYDETIIIWTTTYFHTISNPEYTGKDDPNTKVNEAVQTIKAELCYTAHGNPTLRASMIESIASQMLEKMQKYPALDRVGFAQMDHRVWCECSSCTSQGNPSDNLLEFLLDVAANLKDKLHNEGDARENTFKICSLFYHATAATPKSTANYTTKLSNYLKHVEPWLCDSGMDHIDPYKLTDAEKNAISSNNSGNNWNATMYTAIQFWGDLCETYGADLFFWDYYQNTTSFFIPYNVFNTLRVNYGTFAEFGYDYVFSQMMESKQNFARFKEFLISKLKWNAHPSDEEWEGWYDEYFAGSYGPGASAMREYFNKWDTWTTSHINDYRRNGEYNWKSPTGTAALALDVRTWTDKLTASELEGWINSINDAIAALNVNDPNYDTYRRNIMLEKLTPMYLLMWMHDGYTGYSSTNKFASTTYVKKYGAEFLTWVEEWKIVYDGEGSARRIEPFLQAIRNNGVSGEEVVTNKVITDKQYIDIDTNAIFNVNMLAGSYTVTGDVSGTANVEGGVVTLNTSKLVAGTTYSLAFKNNDTEAVTTFTNVVAINKLSAKANAVTGSNGYYYIDKTYFVEDGETQMWINHNVLTKGKYTVTVNGESATVSTYVAGQLKISVGKLFNGQKCEVVCVDANNNTYIFSVISAKFIRTAEELKALGVGQNRTNTSDIEGYFVLAGDITFEHAEDGSDIVTAGYPAGGDYYFKGTFDGNGYALKNMRVSDGGIFGLMRGATVKNLKLENVYLTNNPPSGVSIQNGGYSSILAFSAPSSTFENITMTIASAPNAWSWKRDSLLVCSGSWGEATFRNITIDASGLTLNTLLGISHSDKNVYENVVIKAANYVAIGYTADSYNANGGVQNTAALMSEFPAGVTFKKVTKSFEIINTAKSVALGEQFNITTSQPSYSYTYTLKEAVNGVSINGNTVSVSNNAKPGETFTVVVTEAEGCVREITFTVIGKNIVVDIYVANGSFTLPNEIKGKVSKVVVDGVQLTDINDKTVSFSDQFADVTKHGAGKEIIIYTDLYTYSGTANLITKAITTAKELQALGVGGGVKGDHSSYTEDGVLYGNGNSGAAGADISGYYVLAGNIDCSDVVFAAGYNIGKHYFRGTLNGCGYTLSNVTVAEGGIFGGMYNATVTNVNFENVSYLATYPSGTKGYNNNTQYGQYFGLFAHGATNLTVSDVNVQISVVKYANLDEVGLFVDRLHSGTFTNINVDASGCTFKTLISRNHSDANVYENVVIKAAGYDAIAYDKANVALTEFPAGVTFKKVTKSFEITNKVKSVALGEQFNITTSQPSYSYTYALKEAVNGVSINGNTVSVSNNAKPGATFTVVVTEEEGCVREITITIISKLDTAVDIDVASGSFTLPNEVEGRISKVIVDGVQLTDINGKTVSLGDNFADKTIHGLGKEIVIYTDLYIYTGTANLITKIITTAQELQALGVGGRVTDANGKEGNGNSATDGADVYGYYVLGGNIDATGVYFSAGYSREKAWFQATLDGRNYTVSNVIVSEGGIFGGMKNATIKNVNFTGVRYHDNLNCGAGYNNNQNWGQYFGLLGHIAYNINVSDINVQIDEVNTYMATALLVFRPYTGSVNTFTNINVDATNLTFLNVLSTHTNDGQFVYENFNIKAAGYDSIALVGEKDSEKITSWPAGVTFERAYLITDGNGVAKPLYEGDVTALGFPAGTKVSVHTAPAATAGTIWSVMGDKSNQVLLHKAADEDYASIQFVLGRDFTNASSSVFFAWINAMVNGTKTYAAGGWLYQNGSTDASTEEKFNAKENGYKYRVFEANSGKFVSDSNPIKAGVVYTLQVYCPKLIDVELATYAISGQPMTIYFANIDSGNAVEPEDAVLNTVVDIDVANGSFTLPNEVEGRISKVIVDGVELTDINGKTVSLSNNFADKTIHGLGKEIVIYTDLYIYTGTANVYTKIIKTAEELKALGVGQNRTNTEDILGYYVLGNDITFEHASDYSDVVTAGYPANGDYYFKATFDGRGYTLYNMRVSDGGIFGLMRNATVKNLNLKNVYLTDDIPEGISKQNGGYMAIFAYSAPSTVFEDINITIASSPNAWSWKRDGLIVNSSSWGAATYRDITIDATGLKLKTLLGTYYTNSNVYENVVITAADYVAIGYTADSYNGNGGVQNTAALMSEFPAGVTFEKAYLITDVNGVERPLYTGDATTLGFPAGTEVYVHTAPAATGDTVWSVMGNKSNKVLLRKGENEDYASIQFVLGREVIGSTVFFAWIHAMVDGVNTYAAGGTLYKNGTTGASTEAHFNAKENGYTYKVFEANSGAFVSESNPIKAGVVYTLQVYCPKLVDVELAVYETSGQPLTIYFANITSGSVIDLAEELAIGVEDGNFVLPTGVEGNVKSILLNGKDIFAGMDGAKATFNKSLMPTAKADLGNKEILIYTDVAVYSIEAVVATKLIRTAEDLKALGVGGNRTNTTNIDGYYALANDITFVHAEDYSDLMAAGYPINGDYSFVGTFDGNGHTLYNMRVSDGGIFGIMRGTVKNLNLRNVFLTDNLSKDITNQGGGYISIFAYVAPNGTFENIDITIAHSPSAWSWMRDGLLVNTGSWGAATFRNILIDASGLKLKTLLGTSHNSNNKYENVVIKAADYVAIGYTADSYNGGVQNTAALMNEFPAGVTFEFSNSMIAQNQANLVDYEVYDGDVTALGFAKGTRVVKAGIDTTAWDPAYASRAKLGYIDTSYDYVDIQLSLSKSCSFTMWDGVSTSYSVSATSVTPNPATNTRTIMFLDANGNSITSFAANTVYTLRVYMKAANGDVLKNFQLTTTTKDAVVYFGNVTFGNDSTAN